ncbi:hypothetical protein [Rathayibacter sp. AY1F9]|uniref:hypothetical protein n=1 Tax=Rathayibacter sp. AY1F9 TaxID=2080563 RepID=UPI0011AFD47B|nr:hypothetical protein [Rathayibacter sp. AY1F9]
MDSSEAGRLQKRGEHGETAEDDAGDRHRLGLAAAQGEDAQDDGGDPDECPEDRDEADEERDDADDECGDGEAGRAGACAEEASLLILRSTI